MKEEPACVQGEEEHESIRRPVEEHESIRSTSPSGGVAVEVAHSALARGAVLSGPRLAEVHPHLVVMAGEALLAPALLAVDAVDAGVVGALVHARLAVRGLPVGPGGDERRRHLVGGGARARQGVLPSAVRWREEEEMMVVYWYTD